MSNMVYPGRHGAVILTLYRLNANSNRSLYEPTS